MKWLRLLLPFACASLPALGSDIAQAPEAVKPLAIGASAPLATLPAMDGSTVELGATFADRPTILIFYRGGWCPFCNRHLAALAESEIELRKLGFQIVAVSPDPVPVLDRTAARQHLQYRLLSDRDLKVSAAYRVVYRIPAADEKDYRANGINLPPIPGQPDFWLPIPTAFIIGRDRRIKFVYFNADPSNAVPMETLLAAARRAAAPSS